MQTDTTPEKQRDAHLEVLPLFFFFFNVFASVLLLLYISTCLPLSESFLASLLISSSSINVSVCLGLSSVLLIRRHASLPKENNKTPHASADNRHRGNRFKEEKREKMKAVVS